MFVGGIGQAAYGASQGDYTSVIGLGLSVGLGFALSRSSLGAGRLAGDTTLDQLKFSEDAYGQKFSDINELVHEIALSTLAQHNPDSVAANREYAGLIYRNGGNFGSTRASIGPVCPARGNCSSSPFAMLGDVPDGGSIVAYWHTHGRASGSVTFDFFSRMDVSLANHIGTEYGGIGGYVGTPAGNAYFIRAGVMPNPGAYLNDAAFVSAIRRTQQFIGKVPVR
jgi:hypothetical protein